MSGGRNEMKEIFDSEFCNVRYIEDKIDLWTAEFKKYFKVYKVQSYSGAIKALKGESACQV